MTAITPTDGRWEVQTVLADRDAGGTAIAGECYRASRLAWTRAFCRRTAPRSDPGT